MAAAGSSSSGASAVWGVVFVVGFVVLLGWYWFTPSGRQYAQRKQRSKAASRPQAISQVGEKTDAGLACPKCGGTQFKAGRKTSTKVAFGAASMLGQAKHVRCVTCGTQYERG